MRIRLGIQETATAPSTTAVATAAARSPGCGRAPVPGPTASATFGDVAQSITRLVVGNNGSPLIRFTGDLKGDITQALGIAGGTFVKSYFNKFTGEMIEIHVHPYMPAGMLLATADQLPYPVNEVGRVFQMRLRRDYYSIDWPQTNRAYPYGTYMDGFLQHYFPPAIGLINNIAPN